LQLTVLTKPGPDLGADKEICSGDSLILYPGLFTAYNWQNGSTQSHMVAKQPGMYSVVVTNNCGTAKDEILIKENTCDIYFPSAFTPNNDGKNDWFKMLGGYNFKEYHLVVYNRWGQKVFETFEPAKGWNGIFGGQLQPTATFVWYCEFKKPGNADKTKMKGTVTLIR
jgi:gliding motility-associated-like protein